MEKNMRDGHAWSGSEPRDPLDAPCPFKDSSRTLEQAFGLYEATFCATTQLLPDAETVRTTLPPSDGSVNVFEKQDPTTQMDCATSAAPLKRSRRSSHRPHELKGPYCWLGQPPNKSLSQKTVCSKTESEQPLQSHDENTGTSSSEEDGIPPQRHTSALCVC